MAGTPSPQHVRFGNPWLALAYAGVIAAAAVSFDLMTVWALTDPQASAPLFVWVQLFLASSLFTCAVGALVVLTYRLPGVMFRFVSLAPDELWVPCRHGRLKVSDIAGVGLARQRRGNWGLAIWTTDGRRAWCGGFQRKAQVVEPQTSTVARAAVVVYQYVLDEQGPDGPLATQALQRHQQVTPYSNWRGYWDPSEEAVSARV